MSGLKWDLCTGHNIHFLLNLLTDLTSVGQVRFIANHLKIVLIKSKYSQDQLQQCMIQMEATFKEHRKKMQRIYVGVEKSNLLGESYSSRYQQQQYYYQKQKTNTISNMSLTCKMQAQASKELHEIKF